MSEAAGWGGECGRQDPMKAMRLTEEEKADLAKAGSKKLDILSRWLDGQLTCSHCRKCTRRCDILEGPGFDMGQIIAAYEAHAAKE